MIQVFLQQEIEKILSQKLKCEIRISSVKNLSGGCINEVYCLQAGIEKFLLKVNSASAFPGMFEAEAKGLQLLASTNTLKIPEVIATGVADNFSFILMEFVEASERAKNFFEDFGNQLALLHQHSTTMFGLNHDNYIGSLPQKNKLHKTVSDFFIYQRMLPQMQIIFTTIEIDKTTIQQFEKLFTRLPEILPDEPPSLIHGDLWSGNYITSSQGTACIIDPAVSYSSREADIAMTKLFGGFDHEFYESYNQTFPLQPGWQNRIDIWNLYPLMVHVNLFGGSYWQQVKGILKRFHQ